MGAAHPPVACVMRAFVVLLFACHPTYWDTPRTGANFFHHNPQRAHFEGAEEVGIRLVRLAPNKWSTSQPDFLLGDAGEYRGLVAADVERVRAALDDAHWHGVRVVLTTLSLPGARWRQHNGGDHDARLYDEAARYRPQAVAFWRDVAVAFRGHPALVAYNLLNEPRAAPEALRALYLELVAAVRSVDPATPIVLDVPQDADPAGFSGFRPLGEPHILYAFHFYQPWENTTWRRNRNRVSYPSRDWNRESLAAALGPVEAWQRAHGVPSNRIFVGEVGCDHRIPGVARYLDDAITLFEARGYHWAFYSFREDDWRGMDYEQVPEAFAVLRRHLR